MRIFVIASSVIALSEALISSDVSRGRLAEAFSSPSGKLTFSPELVIPEPKDPTAMLLQTNAVQILSSKIRDCKANAVFLHGSASSVSTFASEQESARGSFPGPVPLVFCPSDDDVEMADLSEAGIEGVMIPVNGGDEIKSLEEISADSKFIEMCKSASGCGMQPIPEITLGQETASAWKEEECERLVEQLTQVIGEEPVSVVFTVNAASEDQEEPVLLPAVPKSLGKKVPILGSVRVTAGEGRIGAEAGRFKDSGFTGVILRNGCLPGFNSQMDLEIAGIFWNNAIKDLKSTRSKSFSFRSKNNMEKSQATVWGNYQKDIVESGALGDPNEMVSAIDADAGDYQGFA